MNTQKYFFVTIACFISDEVEKKLYSLVTSHDENQARQYALQLEATCELEDLEHDEDWFRANDSVASYRIKGVKEITSYEELEVIKKYIPLN